MNKEDLEIAKESMEKGIAMKLLRIDESVGSVRIDENGMKWLGIKEGERLSIRSMRNDTEIELKVVVVKSLSAQKEDLVIGMSNSMLNELASEEGKYCLVKRATN